MATVFPDLSHHFVNPEHLKLEFALGLGLSDNLSMQAQQTPTQQLIQIKSVMQSIYADIDKVLVRSLDESRDLSPPTNMLRSKETREVLFNTILSVVESMWQSYLSVELEHGSEDHQVLTTHAFQLFIELRRFKHKLPMDREERAYLHEGEAILHSGFLTMLNAKAQDLKEQHVKAHQLTQAKTASKAQLEYGIDVFKKSLTHSDVNVNHQLNSIAEGFPALQQDQDLNDYIAQLRNYVIEQLEEIKQHDVLSDEYKAILCAYFSGPSFERIKAQFEAIETTAVWQIVQYSKSYHSSIRFLSALPELQSILPYEQIGITACELNAQLSLTIENSARLYMRLSPEQVAELTQANLQPPFLSLIQKHAIALGAPNPALVALQAELAAAHDSHNAEQAAVQSDASIALERMKQIALQQFSALLNPLKEKRDQFAAKSQHSDSHSAASETLNTLISALDSQGQAFFINQTIDAIAFKRQCQQAIITARPVLESHRGWAGVLNTLANAICSLLTAFIPNAINYSLTGNFRFFAPRQTDSSQLIHRLSKQIDHTEYPQSGAALA